MSDLRRPIVVGNWKMYLSSRAEVRAAEGIRRLAPPLARKMDIVVCPSFPQLADVRRLFARSRVHVGAQDVHSAELGPFTGDVSASQLSALVRYVIVGHSERRRHHGETDAQVGEKIRLAVRAGLHPVVCVGETRAERDAGETVRRISAQVTTLLDGLPVLELPRLVFAYEPVWAISAGPGKPAPQPDPEDAAEMIGLIRKVAARLGQRRYAEKMRILYGGSVTAKTVAAFVSQPGVDGALPGAASTQPAEFIAIAREILRCRS